MRFFNLKSSLLCWIALLPFFAFGQEIGMLEDKPRRYSLGFQAGVAYDELMVLAYQPPLDKAGSLGQSYSICITPKPDAAWTLSYELEYAARTFLHQTGSRFGTNAEHKGHYMQFLPRFSYKIRPAVCLQLAFGVGLRVSEQVKSDETYQTLIAPEHSFPSYLVLLSPAVQFGKNAFFCRLAYSSAVAPNFTVRSVVDEVEQWTAVRAHRFSVGLGYYFHR